MSNPDVQKNTNTNQTNEQKVHLRIALPPKSTELSSKATKEPNKSATKQKLSIFKQKFETAASTASSNDSHSPPAGRLLIYSTASVVPPPLPLAESVDGKSGASSPISQEGSGGERPPLAMLIKARHMGVPVTKSSRPAARALPFRSGRQKPPLSVQMEEPSRQFNRYIRRAFQSIINGAPTPGGRDPSEIARSLNGRTTLLPHRGRGRRRRGGSRRTRMMLLQSAVAFTNALVKDFIKHFAETADQLMVEKKRVRMTRKIAVKTVRVIFGKHGRQVVQEFHRMDDDMEESTPRSRRTRDSAASDQQQMSSSSGAGDTTDTSINADLVDS